MTHNSQIFRSLRYSVLDNVNQLRGKTIVGVFNLKSDVEHNVTAFVTDGAILILDNGSVVGLINIMDYELKQLEELTGIKEEQLF